MGNEVSVPNEGSSSPLTMRSRPGVQLLELPSELILKICTHLPPVELLNLELVSTFFRSFIIDQAALQYALACYRHSVLPTPQEPGQAFVPVADRLAALERSEANWEGRGRGREWATMSVEGESTIYELQSSVFVRGTNYLLPSGGAANLLQGHRPASIELHPFPTAPSSSSPPSDPSTDPYATIDFNLGPFLDLTLDPAQNLIVLATRTSNGSLPNTPPSYSIHLRGMDGKPHPEAKQEVLAVDVVLEGQGDAGVGEGGVESGRMLLQVLEGTLACLVSNTVSEVEGEVVFCWDWRSGDLISRTPIPDSLVYPSLSLLTPSSFLILAFTVTGICPQITTYHLFSPSQLLGLSLTPPYLHATPRPATELQTILFPRLHHSALARPIMLLDIRPDPPSSNRARVEPQGRTRPHTLDPGRGVLEFDLMAGGRLFGFHLLRDPMVREVERYEARAGKGELGQGEWGGKAKKKEWKEWGEEGCRVFESTLGGQRAWVTFIDGYRTLTRQPGAFTPTSPCIMLRDFNPLRFPPPSSRPDPSSPSFVPRPASPTGSDFSWATDDDEAGGLGSTLTTEEVDALIAAANEVSDGEDVEVEEEVASDLGGEEDDEQDNLLDLNLDTIQPDLAAPADHDQPEQSTTSAAAAAGPTPSGPYIYSDPTSLLPTRFISRLSPTIVHARLGGSNIGMGGGTQTFQEDVVTRLPYREGHVSFPPGLAEEVMRGAGGAGGVGGGVGGQGVWGGNAGVMLDGENVVVTARRGEDDPWTFYVLPM